MSRAQLLKDAILQAAIQGKLTEQLDTDSSVESAILKAYKEKEALGTRHVNTLPVEDKEIPYDLPLSWKWVRLADVVYNRDQKKPEATFSYIDIGSIDNVHQKLNKEETIIEAKVAPSRARKVVKTGDVLYATVRPYLHNICIIDREFTYEPIASTGFAVMVCHSCIFNKYLLYYLISPSFDNYANATDNAKGVAYPAINDKRLYAGLISLPPIEEQKRIVERVDELLAKVDEFEKIEIQLAHLKQNFPSDLRSAILQAAMQGKLTEQLDTDSSVDELVKELKQNKISLSDKDKKKALDIVYFDIPNTWRWVKLSECGATNIGLTYSPTDISLTEGTIVLRSSNIKNGKLDYGDTVRVNMTITDNKMCHMGDILICARNGSRKLVGKTAIIDKEGMAFGAFMAIYRSKCNPYINYVLQSPHFKKSVLGDAETTTINQITQDMLENYIFPLPPIEEQQRIVEILDKLIPLCDELNG